MRFGDPPRWVDRLFVGLMIYSITGTVWMLTGFGGPQVTHYVGLLSDAPATLASVIIAAATVRYTARGVLRTGWILLAVPLVPFFARISSGTGLRAPRPASFPGSADILVLTVFPGL